MKKIFKLFLFAICLIFSLSACGDKANISKDDKVELKSHNTKNIVVTTSFLYDIVEKIAGDTVNVELIIPAGEDPHLYIAKPEDLKKLQSADLVLYHGLHFEGKMVEVLDKLGISVSKQFPKDKIGSMEEDGQVIIDPHFWFDISLYKMAVEETKKALSNLNPKDADLYEKNTEKYLSELTQLDNYIIENIQKIPEGQRYLITPHDAFNYFSKSYGITVKAPQGVSTSSEVSNSDIQETIDFIVEHKIKAVFAESTTDPARMEKLREGVVAKGFDVKIVKGHGNELFSDSLAPKGQEGDNYIDMYKHNVDLIVSNLSN
jgi:zn2+ ABC superfamily ATP binding cassette transporter, binding protein